MDPVEDVMIDSELHILITSSSQWLSWSGCGWVSSTISQCLSTVGVGGLGSEGEKGWLKSECCW